MTSFYPVAFGVGSTELIVIFLIVLLLFGAKRLPELARSLGLAKKEFQKASREVANELENAKEELPPSSSTNSPKPPGNNSKKV